MNIIRSLLCAGLLVPIQLEAQRTITLPPQDVSLTGGMEHLYSIGRMEGEPWETFGGMLEVAFAADGSLYVLDRENAVVHCFDVRGAHRWSAGRSGAGPGELSIVTHMAVLPDGAVVVSDFSNGRLEHFDAAGRHAGSIPLPAQLRPRRIYAAGGRAVWLVPAAPRGGDSLPILRVALDGEATVVTSVAVTGPTVRREGDVLRRELPPTFSPQLRAASAGTRLVLVDGAQYRVMLHDRQPSVLERLLPPRPVTAADRDAARERARRNAENVPSATVGGFQMMPQQPEALEEQLRQMKFARTLPLVQEMRGAPDGTLWIARPGRVAFGLGPIDVIGPDLRYLGTLPQHRLPAAVGPDGLVAFVERNDMDVPSIMVHRLVLRR